ncbi:MAG: CheR family methyltransferase [Myxococcota bacterium]
MSDLALRLQPLVAARVGFAPASVRLDRLERALDLLRAEGLDEQRIVAGWQAGEGRVIGALEEAALVGETFFFREAHHFELVLTQALPAFFASGRPTFRAWSAGCSTGEEAWSLAALLQPHLAARGRGLSVLGTDVSAKALEVARGATYGRWSLRDSAPAPVPVFEPSTGEQRVVRHELRESTRFEQHNLLALPEGLRDFDVIFCRNVLVYFAPAAAREVSATLLSRLTPEGLLCFSAVDLPEAVRDAVPVGASQHNSWKRRAREPVVAPPAPGPAEARRPPVEAPCAPPPEVAVALHLRALALLEGGRATEAQHALLEASRLCPEYLPALLERALIHERRGERGAAAALMRELYARAQQLDGAVPGPEPLPADYFRAAAEAFFSRLGATP